MAVKNQILFSLIIQIIFRVFWFGVGIGIATLSGAYEISWLVRVFVYSNSLYLYGLGESYS